jgi:hypothetical protein
VTFEQILLLYIYKYKKLSLDLFGTIELESNVPDPEILKKEKSIAIEGLKFTFDPLIKTDEAFIQFYASEKGKIIPLAISDIELQLHQAKQIVNIGNPFDIPGIGKIVKMDDGKLTIQPGFFTIPPVSGSGRPVVLRERVAAAPLPKGERETKSDNLTQKQKQIIFLSGIGVLALLVIWAFIKYAIPLFQGSQKNDEVAVVTADTSTTQTQDTLYRPDANTIAATPDSNALQPWKAIIGTALTLSTAQDRLGKLQSYGHNVMLESKDSNNYLLYLPLSATIRDTAQKRDSLAKFFAFPVRIEPSGK